MMLPMIFRDSRGNVSLIAAIATLPMLLGAGAATDYARAFSLSTSLQSAVDAAALAAATSEATSNTVKAQQANKFLHDTKDFAAVTPKVEFAGDAVTVSAAMPMTTSFMNLAGIESITVAATATAVKNTKPICILALNDSAASAIHIYGSGAHLKATDCMVHANSTRADGMDNTSNSVSVAEGFCTVGGFKGSNYNPSPKTKCRKVKDPYAVLPKPSVSGCDFNNVTITTGTVTLNPGIYCSGIVISDSASVTFTSGLYKLLDGPLKINSSGVLKGEEVTFYFTGDGSMLELTGGGKIDLSAPKTGPYAGMVFIGDAAHPPTKSHKINGHAQLKIVGVSYFPLQKLTIGGSGNFGVLSPFMTFVADAIEFHGNGSLTMNFDAEAAGYTMAVPREFAGVRLVQ